MSVFFNPQSLPPFHKPVLTIGTFDGVHLGHQAILREVVEHAKSSGGESVLITFEPHPRKILFPNETLSLLTPLNQKIDYLKETGIDHIVVQPFTEDFAKLTAAEYIEDFLVDRFHPHGIVIGYDHRFGADRKGDIQLLKEFSPRFDYAVYQIPAEMISNAAISSTKIRQALDGGDIATANDMLGRAYSLEGVVGRGAQLGRTIGYPTANFTSIESDQLVPARGVYAVTVAVKDEKYGGMLNIGYRPTVSRDIALHIEAHLFNFDGNLYDKLLTISFIDRLRNEEKFPSVDELKAQLSRDAIKAQHILQAQSIQY